MDREEHAVDPSYVPRPARSCAPSQWVGSRLAFRLVSLVVLLAAIVGSARVAEARSLEEALDSLGTDLARQLSQQEVASFGALQFSFLDGPQGDRESTIASRVGQIITSEGSRASFIGLAPSERARMRFGLPAGANIAGETAARVAKAAGTSAMLVGTVRQIDSQTVELVGQIFSEQRGVILADARVTYQPGGAERVAVAPQAAPQPRPAPRPEPAPQAPPRPAPRAPAPSVMRAEAGQFMIELRGCERGATGLDCAFLLRNQGDNALFTIYNNKTRLFDDQGREFEPSMTSIADTRVDLEGHYSRRIQKQVISGIPTRGTIRFPKVPADAREVASLQLNLTVPGYASAEFRNVPITGGAPPAVSSPPPSLGIAGTAAAVIARSEAGQFRFDLQGCGRSFGGVECVFQVVNQGDNAKLTIFNGKTRLFDDQGREYEPSMTSIADERKDLKGRGGKRIAKQMISGIPTNVRIRFASVAQDASRVASLQLNLYAPGAAKAEFRDIEIAAAAPSP